MCYHYASNKPFFYHHQCIYRRAGTWQHRNQIGGIEKPCVSPAAGDGADEEGQDYCVRSGYTAACVAAPIAACAAETRQNNGPRMPLPGRLCSCLRHVSNPPLHLRGAQHACQQASASPVIHIWSAAGPTSSRFRIEF